MYAYMLLLLLHAELFALLLEQDLFSNVADRASTASSASTYAQDCAS